MGEINLILATLVGLAIGATFTWLILRSRAAREYDRARQEAGSQLAALTERVTNRERELLQIKSGLDQSLSETARLREELLLESARRSAAEERNSRIMALEAELTDKSRLAERLLSDSGALKVRITELETRLGEERKAAEEKGAILDLASAKLSDAFKAASAEALNQNNRAFLDLATRTLQNVQTASRGDLEARQAAIAQLVQPLKSRSKESTAPFARLSLPERRLTHRSPSRFGPWRELRVNCRRRPRTW